MPVIVRKTTVNLQGVCTIEDAEPLLQWLIAHPRGKVHLKDCVNLHSAVLQTLLAGEAQCVGRPSDPSLCAWLDAALHCLEVPMAASGQNSVTKAKKGVTPNGS